ncbi:hypothetical protein SLE2022_004120 [Rubroshorea leprosula]
MAFRLALFVLFALAGVQLSSCQVLKGKVSCLDCSRHYDLSEIKVTVKCDKVKKLAMATTVSGGSFTVSLPTSHTNSEPNKCLARLLGGPNQLYATKKNMVSEVVKVQEHSSSYTISTSLAFSTSCPQTQKATCEAQTRLGSSKTVDLPIPREWGLAPTSYYVPFFPIIGIP